MTKPQAGISRVFSLDLCFAPDMFMNINEHHPTNKKEQPTALHINKQQFSHLSYYDYSNREGYFLHQNKFQLKQKSELPKMSMCVNNGHRCCNHKVKQK